MNDDIAMVEAAAEGQTQPHLVSSALRSAIEEADPRPEAILAVIQALDYDDVRITELERRSQWGPFAPMIETTEGVYPEPLRDASDARRTHWVQILEEVSAPVVRARLGDILWELREGTSPYVYARHAIDAYIAIAHASSAVSMPRSDALSRALELARALNDQERIQTVAAACVTATNDAIASDEHAPGVAISLIEDLARLPPAQQPADLDALISAALDRYEHDPWLASAVTSVALSRTSGDSAAQRQLVERNIAAWVKAADTTDGMVATSHLEKALNLARQHGRTDLAASLRLKLQEASESVDLSRIEASVQMPREQIEEYLDSFVQSDQLHRSLARFGAHCPLPEDRNETADYVRELMAEHPLQYLVTKVVLGPGNLPIQYVSSPEEHFVAAMHQQEAMGVELWGLFAADVLDRIKAKFSPSVDEIRTFFETSEVTRPVAARLADAFALHWEGRHDAALLTTLPRLEASIREMSRQIGLVIFVEPQANQPGKLKGLGALLSDLVGRLDERRRHYLFTLLANPLGANLRNNALHGLVLEGTKEQSALSLHAATLLGLFTLHVDDEKTS